MDLGNSKYPLETDAYTDLAALNKLKTSAVKNDPGAIKEVAKQFESIFLNMMLKSMRAANESFAENDIFNSKESRFYQEMLDQQYSLSMSKSQGIGLAKIIEKQLQGLATVRNPLAPDAEVSIESVDKPNTNDGFDFDKRLLARSGQKTASDINAAESYFGDKQVLASDHKSRPVNAHANAPVSSDQPDAVGSDNNDKLVSLNENFQSPSEFVSGLWQIAQSAAKLLSADPKILIAQAALETGWGKHIIADKNGKNSFNLFNIKADSRWAGESVSKDSLEYEDGVAVRRNSQFRSYNSFEESFRDYVEFIQSSPRYRNALSLASKPIEYIRELQNSGYATDPNYAAKVERIFNSELFK